MHFLTAGAVIGAGLGITLVGILYFRTVAAYWRRGEHDYVIHRV